MYLYIIQYLISKKENGGEVGVNTCLLYPQMFKFLQPANISSQTQSKFMSTIDNTMENFFAVF